MPSAWTQDTVLNQSLHAARQVTLQKRIVGLTPSCMMHTFCYAIAGLDVVTNQPLWPQRIFIWGQLSLESKNQEVLEGKNPFSRRVVSATRAAWSFAESLVWLRADLKTIAQSDGRLQTPFTAPQMSYLAFQPAKIPQPSCAGGIIVGKTVIQWKSKTYGL